MSIKDLTIIITTFRSEKVIRKCLKNIDTQCKVINVENSDDREYKNKIEKDFKNVECILTGANLGYAKGNNLGLKITKTKYALILNPDANLFPNTLENFLISSARKLDWAVIGPNFNKENSNHEAFNKSAVKEVEKVKGYAMFLNLSEFKDVGFFDENFFIYLEEIDLCKRLINKGKKIYIDANIKIFHDGGKSHDSSINFEMELSRNWHWMWSTFYFNKKHSGFFISLITVIPKLISSILKSIFFLIIFNKKKKEIYFQRFSGLMNSIIGKSSWYRPRIKR